MTTKLRAVDLETYSADDRKRPTALRRRVARARRFPTNTCPASRHLNIMADCLLAGGYPMLTEEPAHCAESILATLESLWLLRTERVKQRRKS